MGDQVPFHDLRNQVPFHRRQTLVQTGTDKTPPKIVSGAEESKVARPTSIFIIVHLDDYDVAEKTIHFIQAKHMDENPEFLNAEAEENFMEAEFNVMVDIKNLIYKTSVDPKLQKLKVCLRRNSLHFSTNSRSDSVRYLPETKFE